MVLQAFLTTPGIGLPIDTLKDVLDSGLSWGMVRDQGYMHCPWGGRSRAFMTRKRMENGKKRKERKRGMRKTEAGKRDKKYIVPEPKIY